jgi:hypothetical protein
MELPQVENLTQTEHQKILLNSVQNKYPNQFQNSQNVIRMVCPSRCVLYDTQLTELTMLSLLACGISSTLDLR